MSFDSILPKLQQERSAFSSILLIIGIVLLAMVIGNIAAAFVMILISNIGVADLENLNAALMSSNSGWWALLIGQGVASVITFILAGLFYWRVVEKKALSDLNFASLPNWQIFAFVILIQVCALPLNGYLQEINQQMKLPESLAGLEKIMKNMEDTMAEVTEYLTNFDSILKTLVGFIVIAVVAGIGEELIFRGLIQRKLYLLFKNPHLAIWTAAFIFSAIHFQFYGFLPRLLLGALFGYFYLWTGNLWIPIAAHIFNNGFAVVMYYFFHQGQVSEEFIEMDAVPKSALAASVCLTIGLIFIFLKGINKQSLKN